MAKKRGLGTSLRERGVEAERIALAAALSARMASPIGKDKGALTATSATSQIIDRGIRGGKVLPPPKQTANRAKPANPAAIGQVKAAVLQVFANATPSEPVKRDWKVTVSHVRREVRVSLSPGIPEGHRIYVHLLAGHRRRGWTIRPSKSPVLVWIGDDGKKVFARKAWRRWPHKTKTYIHPKFRGVVRKAQAAANGVLRASGVRANFYDVVMDL